MHDKPIDGARARGRHPREKNGGPLRHRPSLDNSALADRQNDGGTQLPTCRGSQAGQPSCKAASSAVKRNAALWNTNRPTTATAPYDPCMTQQNKVNVQPTRGPTGRQNQLLVGRFTNYIRPVHACMQRPPYIHTRWVGRHLPMKQQRQQQESE